jgi:hypothetical protein
MCAMRGKLDHATPLVHITPSMEPPDWNFFTWRRESCDGKQRSNRSSRLHRPLWDGPSIVHGRVSFTERTRYFHSLPRMQWRTSSTPGRNGKTSVSQHNLMVVSPLQEAATPDVTAHRGGTQARLPGLRKLLFRRYICPCARSRWKP